MTPEEIAALLQQPNRQQALLDVLRGKQSLGYTGQLTGDKVLAPFGANLQREAMGGLDDVANQGRFAVRSLLDAQRTSAYEKSVQAGMDNAAGRSERDAQRLDLERQREERKIAEAKNKKTALPGALARKDAAAKAKADEKAKAGAFRDASALRKEFNSLPDVRSFNESRTSFEKIQSAAKTPSAARDLALIFGYMKVLDPGSTVREGEFANAQNAAGVPERIRNAWNKVVSGERLNDAQRADFVKSAGSLFAAQKKSYAEQAKRYRGLAEKSGISPDDVTGPFEDVSAPTPGGAAPSPRSGTVRVSNGKETLEIDASDLEDARADGFEEVP